MLFGSQWRNALAATPRQGAGVLEQYTQPQNALLAAYGDAMARTRSRAGLLEQGNIDLSRRPMAPNGDGYSTVRSIDVAFDDGTYSIPTVSDDGRLLSDDEAIELFRRTGRHLGKLRDDNAARGYGEALHLSQEQMYSQRGRR